MTKSKSVTKSKLVVNANAQEVRVGVLENKKLAEVYIERSDEQSVVGNIYKGKVNRVLPGMQAAFVDIGLERAAFLYVSDILTEMGDAFDPKEIEKERTRQKNHDKIEFVLQQGQEIMVQVAKDPISTKGARVTSHISLPSRNLVYMPTVNRVGVSRKIDDDKERKRLRSVIDSVQSLEGGFIIRTAASVATDETIADEVEYLERLWKKILKDQKTQSSPAVLHEDLGLLQRLVRDHFSDDVEEIIVDDKKTYQKVSQFLERNTQSKAKQTVSLYEEQKPIFDQYQLDDQLNKALGKKVWLKSGGYLIIEQTEALTSIDVNTGRFVGSNSLEETVLQTNLEAVEEIVSQLRLRNIGGLIILDIIDMEKHQNREKVYKRLEECLADDRAKTNVLQISELGLVEMTRKRTRESLSRSMCEPCNHCEGKGYHKSPTTVCYEILRKLEYKIVSRNSHENVEVCVHPSVGLLLKKHHKSFISFVEQNTGRKVVLKEFNHYQVEHFNINFTGLGLRSKTTPTAENVTKSNDKALASKPSKQSDASSKDAKSDDIKETKNIPSKLVNQKQSSEKKQATLKSKDHIKTTDSVKKSKDLDSKNQKEKPVLKESKKPEETKAKKPSLITKETLASIKVE